MTKIENMNEQYKSVHHWKHNSIMTLLTMLQYIYHLLGRHWLPTQDFFYCFLCKYNNYLFYISVAIWTPAIGRLYLSLAVP